MLVVTLIAIGVGLSTSHMSVADTSTPQFIGEPDWPLWVVWIQRLLCSYDFAGNPG